MKGLLHRSAYLIAPLAALLFLLAACGGDEETSSTASPRSTVAPTVAASAQPSQPAACKSPSLTAPEVTVKQYDKAPDMTIDAAKKYTAIVKTVRGDFTIELWPDLAPQHVNSFVFLARDHYFDGVTFHRVIPGFVAQAGDPTGTGSGGPGYTLPAEFTDEPYIRGVVGMARSSDPNSAGSQWFVTYANAANLNGAYTVFGKVTQGMDVVDCITPRDPSRNPNLPTGDAIISIEVQEQ